MCIIFKPQVMGKVFTEHTHIVAVKTTGNVYCWEAVEELNVRGLTTVQSLKCVLHRGCSVR